MSRDLHIGLARGEVDTILDALHQANSTAANVVRKKIEKAASVVFDDDMPGGNDDSWRDGHPMDYGDR